MDNQRKSYGIVHFVEPFIEVLQEYDSEIRVERIDLIYWPPSNEGEPVDEYITLPFQAIDQLIECLETAKADWSHRRTEAVKRHGASRDDPRF